MANPTQMEHSGGKVSIRDNPDGGKIVDLKLKAGSSTTIHIDAFGIKVEAKTLPGNKEVGFQLTLPTGLTEL